MCYNKNMSEMFVPQFRHDTIISPDEKRADQLQKQMIDLMRFRSNNEDEESQNENKIDELKKEYIAQYPDQREGIEVIFDLKRFLGVSNRIDTEKGIPPKEKRGMFEDLTEYQFLITHYILEAGKTPGGRKFLRNFWQLGETIAANEGQLGSFIGIKKGVLGQVASYRIMDELGYSPQLSKPRLDARYSVDMILEDNQAIQVKTDSSKEPKVLELRDTDEVGIPAVFYNKKGEKMLLTESHVKALKILNINLKKLAEKTGEVYSGKEFIIPIRMLNENTGEPNQEAIKFFEEELGRGSNERGRENLSMAA